MTYRTLLPASVASAILCLPVAAQTTGLTAETWNNLTPGKSILILREEGISGGAPDSSQTVANASVTGLPANSGTRLRGTLTPPVDDTYTFWVNGADNVALWLSEDGTRFTKRLISSHLGTTTSSEWGKFPSQKSLPIALTAGTTYHIEAHVMSSTANGHVSVAWQGRDGNWALAANGATATQSTTQWNASASRAIDGNTKGRWSQSEPTLTSNQPNSWFQVDFAQEQPTNEVVLFNNAQNQNRLSNFRISILDALGAELVGENFFTTTGNVGNSFTWNLPSTVTAKSVKIQLLGNNLAGNGHLSLAEVQAFGPGPLAQTRNFEVIPGAYLSPVTADSADTNDNHLPDTWETQTGLDISTLPGALLEYGDPDQDGITNYDEFLFGSDPLSAESLGDVVTRSMWMDLTGNGSEGIPRMTNGADRQRFLGYANEISLTAGIDTSSTQKNFGSRYRGSFIAPTTGSYRFWLAASGDAGLWISDGSVEDPTTSQSLTNRFGKQLVATSGHVTPQHDFDYEASQRSRPVTLVQGQTYYIEVLHKEAQGKVHHVSVAWKVPGQSREIIPATAFIANAPDAADADDDGLPDSWETTVGLNPANNGQFNAGEGEYGDPDADGLSNLLEYQHGTDPFSADSDGDGISDFDEINLYGTDPLVSNNLAPTVVQLPALNQYSAITGNWIANANGSITALERRGEITYTFTITEPGVHEVELVAVELVPSPWITSYFNVELSVDGSKIARKTMKTRYGSTATLRAITPWIAPGTHTVTVFHDNYDAARKLRIDSLTLKRLGGEDLDENDIPDWIETKEAIANALIRVPTTSLTSPVSIEGITRQIATANLTVLTPAASEADDIEATASINDSFFADVPLSADGPVSLNASFLSGVVTDSRTITWTPTNLLDTFTDDTLHIRQGDSLRVTAHDPASAPEGSFTLSGTTPGLPTGSINSDSPEIITFDTAGTYTLTATWTPTSGPTQSATLSIVAHSADFGPSHVVKLGSPGVWTPTSLGDYHLIEADNRLVFNETTTTGSRNFLAGANEAVNSHVIARLPSGVDGAPSGILALGTVHCFEFIRVGQTRDASIVTQYPDGTWLMSNTFVAVNLPPDVFVRIFTQNQGTLFTDGNTTWDLTASDFDLNGIATVFYEWSGTGNPTMCHRSQVFLKN